MVIALVDDGDAHRGAREFLSGGQPTEAGPDDDDMVQVHILRSLAQTSLPNPRDCLAKSRSPYTVARDTVVRHLDPLREFGERGPGRGFANAAPAGRDRTRAVPH